MEHALSLLMHTFESSNQIKGVPMKKIIVMIGLLSISLTALTAEAKVVKCSYVSKINSLTGDRDVSDEIIYDTSVSGAKTDAPLFTRNMIEGILKVYSSGENLRGIAIELLLPNAGTVSASSYDSSGSAKSVVHLHHVNQKPFNTQIFTSVKCEFVTQRSNLRNAEPVDLQPQSAVMAD